RENGCHDGFCKGCAECRAGWTAARDAGYVSAMSRAWTEPLAAVGRSVHGFFAGFGRFARFAASAVRSVRDVATWGSMLVLHMARLGVDSLPIAVFIAAFTGIVLALQASYTFTGAIPLYFVGVLVEKTMILEL